MWEGWSLRDVWRWGREPVLIVGVIVAAALFGIDVVEIVEDLTDTDLPNNLLDAVLMLVGVLVARGRVRPI